MITVNLGDCRERTFPNCGLVSSVANGAGRGPVDSIYIYEEEGGLSLRDRAQPPGGS